MPARNVCATMAHLPTEPPQIAAKRDGERGVAGMTGVNGMIRLFGRPFVALPGGPAEAFPASSFVVVALLNLVFGRAAGRAEMAARLREDETSESANNFLRQVISRSRKWERANQRVAFRCSRSDVWIDATTMMSDLEAFLQFDRVATEADLKALMALYRGDFLAGYDHSGDELTQWILIERSALYDRFIRLALDGATRLGGVVCDDTLSRLQVMAPGDDRVVQAMRARQKLLAAAASARAGACASIADAPRHRARRPLDGMPQLAMFPPVAGPYTFGPR